jgi:virginiamycin B lyase
MVENLCTGCHKTNMITRSSGYTREGWTLVSTMIDLSSVPEDRDAILQ